MAVGRSVGRFDRIENAMAEFRRAIGSPGLDHKDRAALQHAAAVARELEGAAGALAASFEADANCPELRAVPLPQVATERRAGRFKVLVVEDDAAQRDALASCLSLTFDVRAVPDGAEAVVAMREDPPDVVVTDLQMPRLDGMSLLQFTRSSDDAQVTPVIVITGSPNVDTRVLAFEAGACDVICKPVAGGELIARVRNALSQAQSLRYERNLQVRDELTGLLNRRAFRSSLQIALRRLQTRAQPFAVVLMDQDGLKQINDCYGHLNGDRAIRMVAEVLAISARGSDCVARIGGDEFAILMPNCTEAGAASLVERAREAIDRLTLIVRPGLEIRLGASFGIAYVEPSADTDSAPVAERIIEAADQQLYRDKEARRAAARGEARQLPA